MYYVHLRDLNNKPCTSWVHCHKTNNRRQISFSLVLEMGACQSTIYLPSPRTTANKMLYWVSVKLGWKEIEISDHNRSQIKTTFALDRENAPAVSLKRRVRSRMNRDPDVVPLLRVNDDAKVFRQHHVVLKINNRLRRPGMNHLERQLNYKTRYTNIEQSVQHESSREPHLQSVTRNCYNEYNKRTTRLAYRPLRLPTSLHLTARYRYALESSDAIIFSVL